MKYKDLPKDYKNLEKLYKPKKIENEEEYKLAFEIINPLFDNQKLSTDQQEYLLDIVEYIEEYEDIHYPIK